MKRFIALFLLFFASCSVSPTTTSTTLPPSDWDFKWNILVYLDADNNLERYATYDIDEMESALAGTEDFNIIVLVDRYHGMSSIDGENWTNARAYRILPNTLSGHFASERIALPELGISTTMGNEVDMGSTNTLIAFVDHCLSNYPADYNMLIFWNHGEGWKSVSSAESKSVCEDDTSGSILLNSEIAAALSGKNIDVIGFDACRMGSIEILAELQSSADYLIGSPYDEPGNGWNYTDFLFEFARSDGTPTSLVQSAVSTYATNYEYRTSTLMGYDLSRVPDLLSAFEEYATNLCSLTNAYTNAPNEYLPSSFCVRTNIESVLHYSTDYHIDLGHLAAVLSNEAATDLISAIGSTVVSKWIHPYLQDASGIWVYHRTPFKGYSSNFPYGFSRDFAEYSGSYTNFSVFQGSSAWVDFLRAYWLMPAEETLQAWSNLSLTDDKTLAFFAESAGDLFLRINADSDTENLLMLYGYEPDSATPLFQFSQSGTLNSNHSISLTQSGWYILDIYRQSGSGILSMEIEDSNGLLLQ